MNRVAAGFFRELKRRNVLRAAAMYLSAAWLLAQLVTTLDDLVSLPDWLGEVFLVVAGIGLPVTLVLSWRYDITQAGVRREAEIRSDPELARVSTRGFDLAIIVVLSVALGYFIWESRFRTPQVLDDVLDVVVLPVRDISRERDQAWFANGLTEELTRALVGVPTLRVIGRSTAARFDPARQDSRSFGAGIGASHVIDSSINSDGEKMRVTSELTRVDDGFTVWSTAFEDELDDLLEIQRRIAIDVARSLEVHLDESRVASTANRSSNFAAYQAYLQGRLYFSRRTPAALESAQRYFEQSLALDPAQSMAHSGLAAVHALGQFYVADPDPGRSAALTKRHAQEAIALDGDNAEAHAILGSALLYFDRDFDGAAAEFARAYELAPGDAEILNACGDFHYWIGDFATSFDFEERAAALDPLSAVNHLELGIVLGFLGNYGQAANEARLARELNPALANAAWQHFRLSFFGGDMETARAVLADAAATMGASFEAHARVRLALHDGDDEAARAITAGRAAVAEAGDESASTVALLYALLGEDALAARWVDVAFESRDAILVSPMYFFLPDDWAHLPRTAAALTRGDVAALYELRRRHRQ